MRNFTIIVLVLCFLFICLIDADGKDVELAWDANSEESLVGYNVYERHGDLEYYFIDEAFENRYTRLKLPVGIEYFWVVTAYNLLAESDFSNEVSAYHEEGETTSEGGCFISTIIRHGKES